MLSSFSNAEAFLRCHRRLVPDAGAAKVGTDEKAASIV